MSKPSHFLSSMTIAAVSDLLGIEEDDVRDLLEAHADELCARCGIALREHAVLVPAHDFIGEEDLQ